MFDKIKAAVPAIKNAAAKVAKAAAAGAIVAGLTAVANAIPDIALAINLDPAATGQVVALVLLTRDALKARVEK